MISLLRRLVSGVGRNRTDTWELIGVDTVGHRSLERVPGWLLRRVGRIAGERSGSTLGLQTTYLKGRRYRYKVVFRGKVPSGMCVYRRRR